MMGSPKDEEGRTDWEQLPHEVAIDEGFWMFATPCTQALWEAIMGANPSLFQSPDRPVERVSEGDCDSFARKLSERIGLTLALPSESQWEFACRAGTSTSTYAGPLEIKGENNAPILDAIAWYGGNSGHEFDLANGVDASARPEKQYPFDKAGTRLVAKKRANPWGLYDMLGNVFEWCADEGVHGGAWGGVRRPGASGRLVGRRRTGRARGVPLPQQARDPARRRRLPSCRVQDGS